MVPSRLQKSEPDSSQLNRRDRKKLLTRRAIRCAALDLFSERGYDNVTVAEITEAADVSAMTFYRHFGTKEAVITSVIINPDTTEILAEIVRMTDYAGLEAKIEELFADSEDWGARLAERVILLHENPSLIGHVWQHSTQWVDCITEQTGNGVASRTRARSLIGIFIECIVAWAKRPDFPEIAGLKALLVRAIPATLAPLSREDS